MTWIEHVKQWIAFRKHVFDVTDERDGLPDFDSMTDEEYQDHVADVKIDAARLKKRLEQVNLDAGLNADGTPR